MKKMLFFVLPVVAILFFFASCEDDFFQPGFTDTTGADPSIDSTNTADTTGSTQDEDTIPSFIPDRIESLEELERVMKLCDYIPYSPTTGENWLRNTEIDTSILYSYYRSHGLNVSSCFQNLLDHYGRSLNRMSLMSERLLVGMHYQELWDCAQSEPEIEPSTLPNLPDTVRRIPVLYDNNLTEGTSHTYLKSCFNIGESGHYVVEAISFNTEAETIYVSNKSVAKTILATFIYQGKTWIVFSIYSGTVYAGFGFNRYVSLIENGTLFLCK